MNIKVNKFSELNDFEQKGERKKLKKLNGMVWKFDISNLTQQQENKLKDKEELRAYFETKNVRSLFGRTNSIWKYLSCFIYQETLYVYLKFGFGMAIFNRDCYTKFWNKINSELKPLDIEAIKIKSSNIKSYEIKIPKLYLVDYITKADKGICYNSFENMYNKLFSTGLEKMTEYYNYGDIGTLSNKNRKLLRNDKNVLDLLIQKTLKNGIITDESIRAWRFVSLLEHGFNRFKDTYNVSLLKNDLVVSLETIKNLLKDNKRYTYSHFRSDFYLNEKYFKLFFKGLTKKFYSKLFKKSISREQDFEVLKFTWKKETLDLFGKIKENIKNKCNIKVPFDILETDDNTQKLFLFLLIESQRNGLSGDNKLKLAYIQAQNALSVSRRTIQRKLKKLKRLDIIDYSTARPNSQGQRSFEIRWFDDLVE